MENADREEKGSTRKRSTCGAPTSKGKEERYIQTAQALDGVREHGAPHEEEQGEGGGGGKTGTRT